MLDICFGVLSGVAFHLFSFDRPKPRRSFGPRDCTHVQDWSEQVWSFREELDPEVCNGLVMLQLGSVGAVSDLGHAVNHVCYLLLVSRSRRVPIVLSINKKINQTELVAAFEMFALLLSAALQAWIYVKLNLLRKPSCEALKRFPSLCAATIIFKICMGSEYAEMAITLERASRCHLK